MLRDGSNRSWSVRWGVFSEYPWYWEFWGDKYTLNPITNRVKQPFDGRTFLCLILLVCSADLQQSLAVSQEWLRGAEDTHRSSEMHTRFIWQRRKKTKKIPVANAACPALQRWVELSLRCILGLSSDWAWARLPLLSGQGLTLYCQSEDWQCTYCLWGSCL